MTPALDIDAVSAGYGEAVVLREIALTVAPGEILAVLGKNGTGKSTLLKSIMGYLPKLAGRIAIGGADVTREAPHRIARRGVAYVAQEKSLFQDLSVEENIRLALASDRDWPKARAAVERSFPFLLERIRQRAGTLSGGEQKMLLMARSLAADPKLLLVDEITEGLQPSVIERLGGVLRAERGRSATGILLVEQHIPFALAVADRFVVMDRGEIVDAGAAGAPGAAAEIARHLSL